MAVVTTAQYRTLTQDNNSSDADAQSAIEDATELLNGFLGRVLTEGTYTETLPVHPGGKVYPRAVPVSSVSASATYQVHPERASLIGVDSDESTLPLSNLWDDFEDSRHQSFAGLVGRVQGYECEYPFGTVLYTGGFTSDTLPYALRRAICLIAKKTLANPELGYQAGVRMARLGDAQIQYTADTVSGELDTLVPGITASIKRWRLDR